MRSAWMLLPVAALCAPPPALAQSGEPAARKEAAALRVPAGSVRVDGRLSDEAWTLAVPVTDFVQSEPVEGAAPTDPIEVRFAYDEDALYVAARMRTSDPAGIQAPMGRRDEGIDQAERFFVYLDTYLDRRTACSSTWSACRGHTTAFRSRTSPRTA